MNEKIREQVFGVLDKYDKGFSAGGVLANLEQWQNNKGWLVELLRRHPTWNEDALPFVFQLSRKVTAAQLLPPAYCTSKFR